MTMRFAQPVQSGSNTLVASFASATAVAARLALRALRASGAPVARWWRNRQAIAMLGEADDFMLKDLGIGRGEIEDVVRNGRDR